MSKNKSPFDILFEPFPYIIQIITQYLHPCSLSRFQLNGFEERNAFDVLEYLLDEFKVENYAYLQNYIDYSIFSLVSLYYSKSKSNAAGFTMMEDMLVKYVLAALQFKSFHGMQWIVNNLPGWSDIYNTINFWEPMEKAGVSWSRIFFQYLPDPFESCFTHSGFYYCSFYQETALLDQHFSLLPDELGLPYFAQLPFVHVQKISAHLADALKHELYKAICQLPKEDKEKGDKLKWILQKYTPINNNIRHFWWNGLKGAIASNDTDLVMQIVKKKFHGTFKSFVGADNQRTLLHSALQGNQLHHVLLLLNELPIQPPLKLYYSQEANKWLYISPLLCADVSTLELFVSKTELEIKDLQLCFAIKAKCNAAVDYILAYLDEKDFESHGQMSVSIDTMCRMQDFTHLPKLCSSPIFNAKHAFYMMSQSGNFLTQETILLRARQMIPYLDEKNKMSLLERLCYCKIQNKLFYMKDLITLLDEIPISLWDQLYLIPDLHTTLELNRWKCNKENKKRKVTE